MTLEEFDRESPRWEHVAYLFGSYLNQDVLDNYGDLWPAISAFRAENTAADCVGAAQAARHLSAEFDDDETTERAADLLGLAYSPRADGWSCQEWLIAVADFLEADT